MKTLEIPQPILDKANELVKKGHNEIYINAFLMSMHGASVNIVKDAFKIAINNPSNFH